MCSTSGTASTCVTPAPVAGPPTGSGYDIQTWRRGQREGNSQEKPQVRRLLYAGDRFASLTVHGDRTASDQGLMGVSPASRGHTKRISFRTTAVPREQEVRWKAQSHRAARPRSKPEGWADSPPTAVRLRSSRHVSRLQPDHPRPPVPLRSWYLRQEFAWRLTLRGPRSSSGWASKVSDYLALLRLRSWFPFRRRRCRCRLPHWRSRFRRRRRGGRRHRQP